MGEDEPKQARKPPGQPLGSLVLLMLLPIIGGVVGYFGSVLYTYVQPKKYESVTVLQVHPPVQEIDPFGGTPNQAPRGAIVTPQFMATEFQIITAEQTLQRVVERLDLTARWAMSPEAVHAVLRQIVKAEPIEGTDLVTIRVRHSSPDSARDIAEKVAEAYKERRTAIEIERAQRALSALDSELRDQEDLVEEKRKVLGTIVQALGIPYQEDGADDGGEGNRSTRAKEALRRVEQALFELETEQKALDFEVQMLLKLENEALLDHVLNLGTAPQGLRELRREHRIESKMLAALEGEGVVDWDGDLVRQRAKVEVLAKELQEAVLALRNGLQMKLALIEGRVKAMREMLAARRDAAVDIALEAHDFVQAKREYERARDMLESMERQHSTRRIALKIPRTPITIHEVPRKGSIPVEPDIEANIAMGVVGGAAIGLILAILLGVMRSLSGPRPQVDEEWA